MIRTGIVFILATRHRYIDCEQHPGPELDDDTPVQGNAKIVDLDSHSLDDISGTLRQRGFINV